MALSKGVYRKDDCVKLTSKDANNTRRSKQNTYHVVNKNIARSKLPMEVDERGDAFRGIPKLWLFGVLGLSWGFHGHPQAWDLATPCSIIHKKNSPKTWKLHNTKLNRNLVSSVRERKQKTTLRYCRELVLYLYRC